jgi:hypothetical protein
MLEFDKQIKRAADKIEQTIGTSILPQLRTLSLQMKTVQDKQSNELGGSESLLAKVDKTHEIIEDHLDLLQVLNGKIDTTAALVDENKAFIIEKLRSFENSVIRELKQATEHLDLAAYETSFDRLEKDLVDTVKELGTLRSELNQDKDAL